MATITASMVKELRDKTGAGMMDCKTALGETNGDMEAAIDWLRKKGLSKAAKKAGRIAAEGLVGVAADKTRAALVEVNSETDFVARNAQFQELVGTAAKMALDTNSDIDALLAAKVPGAGVALADHVSTLIATIGENMTVRRTAALAVEKGVVGSYMHAQAAPGLGKIGVIVALESTGDADKLAEVGRQLAMHIAAASPLAVTADELDKALIERERQVYLEQAKTSGKPQEIIEKMVEGRLRKEFFQQAVLLQQVYVHDGKETVEKSLKAAEKSVGGPIKVKGFFRFALGEGVEKKEEDFAAEVAAAAKGR
ncbi:MAG: translation elongation factor Ts [Hyphomicrobiaceae bacterium]